MRTMIVLAAVLMAMIGGAGVASAATPARVPQSFVGLDPTHRCDSPRIPPQALLDLPVLTLADEPARRSFLDLLFDKVIDNAGAMVGGAVGGTIGFVTGGPFGALAGTVAGAASVQAGWDYLRQPKPVAPPKKK